jgi:hypothetical protein
LLLFIKKVSNTWWPALNVYFKTLSAPGPGSGSILASVHCDKEEVPEPYLQRGSGCILLLCCVVVGIGQDLCAAVCCKYHYSVTPVAVQVLISYHAFDVFTLQLL